MTAKQIETKAAREMIKFTTAQKIREILDTAAAQYDEQPDDESFEEAVLEMVTE